MKCSRCQEDRDVEPPDGCRDPACPASMTAIPKPLTEAEIAEIRAAVKFTPDGPWESEGYGHGINDDGLCEDAVVLFAYGGRTQIVVETTNSDFLFSSEDRRAIADFIAAARTDVPRLLDAHASLVAQLEAAKERERVLREALRPFADIALERDESEDDRIPDMISGPDLDITPEQVRDARAALRQGD